jgi:hypothetical protein
VKQKHSNEETQAKNIFRIEASKFKAKYKTDLEK